MLSPPDLRRVLPGLPRIAVSGPWYRAVAFDALLGPPPGAPAGSTIQPLWSGAARRRGARFTPKETSAAPSFGSLYVAEDETTPLVEVTGVLRPPGRAVRLVFPPLVLLTVDGSLANVVDFTGFRGSSSGRHEPSGADGQLGDRAERLSRRAWPDATHAGARAGGVRRRRYFRAQIRVDEESGRRGRPCSSSPTASWPDRVVSMFSTCPAARSRSASRVAGSVPRAPCSKPRPRHSAMAKRTSSGKKGGSKAADASPLGRSQMTASFHRARESMSPQPVRADRLTDQPVFCTLVGGTDQVGAGNSAPLQVTYSCPEDCATIGRGW